MSFIRFPVRSLADWQEHLRNMYSNVNSQREVLETFARLTEMATGISRGVREQDFDIRRKFFPRFLAWLMGLCNQLEVDLESATFNAYPGVCAYCRKDRGCACKAGERPKTRLRDHGEIRSFQSKSSKPRSLDEWIAMFGRIYGNINKVTTTSPMVSHFFEELGEVCEIIRFSIVNDLDLGKWGVEFDATTIRMYLNEEIADLFAWFCGLAFELGVEVEAELHDIYQAMCNECYKPICECSPYRVHSRLRLGANSKSDEKA